MTSLHYWIVAVLHVTVLSTIYWLRLTEAIVSSSSVPTVLCLMSASIFTGDRRPGQGELVKHFGRDVLWPVFVYGCLAVMFLRPEVFVSYCVLFIVGAYLMRPVENTEPQAD